MGRRSEARRWSVDEDGWLNRPALARDFRLPATGRFIGNGCHSFISEDGRIYCRNAKQRRRIDNGLLPTREEGADRHD